MDTIKLPLSFLFCILIALDVPTVSAYNFCGIYMSCMRDWHFHCNCNLFPLYCGIFSFDTQSRREELGKLGRSIKACLRSVELLMH